MGDFWVGGTDQENEGDWMWIDGSGFVYQNWQENEPGGGTNENCLWAATNEPEKTLK